ncbi:uncharacterized protein LOC143815994 isoform X3 [Ranitomeya variabilis]|uniref:uncharacterized protein LOC143815994 isoform X3 n=1 Tax=Ranitomeya variabilis TaxID=490064 RepID=UPI004055BF85
MERLLRLQLLATSTKPTKSRFLQLGQRLIDKCKQTTFFSQGTQGRAQQRRPTRRSRRKNGNEIPDPLITPYRAPLIPVSKKSTMYIYHCFTKRYYE